MGKTANKVGLTRLELRIMQVIWRRGRCTVSDVQGELEPPLGLHHRANHVEHPRAQRKAQA